MSVHPICRMLEGEFAMGRLIRFEQCKVRKVMARMNDAARAEAAVAPEEPGLRPVLGRWRLLS